MIYPPALKIKFLPWIIFLVIRKYTCSRWKECSDAMATGPFVLPLYSHRFPTLLHIFSDISVNLLFQSPGLLKCTGTWISPLPRPSYCRCTHHLEAKAHIQRGCKKDQETSKQRKIKVLKQTKKSPFCWSLCQDAVGLKAQTWITWLKCYFRLGGLKCLEAATSNHFPPPFPEALAHPSLCVSWHVCSSLLSPYWDWPIQSRHQLLCYSQPLSLLVNPLSFWPCFALFV